MTPEELYFFVGMTVGMYMLGFGAYGQLCAMRNR
jgi:hypothetical protein